MNYYVRLADVCLASCFLLNFALELLALTLSPVAIRCAARMRPASGARLLLLLRLAPSCLALAGVFAFCLPSYLRFEQDASESIGCACTVLALCGLAMVCASAVRLIWGLRSSAATQLDELAAGSNAPIFALVGFLRPRVVVSNAILSTLSHAQMEAALLHEAAHAGAGDNLKRLAMLAAPRPLFLACPLRPLEEQWARLAEWAADDAAVAGQPTRAFALAEALVAVARSCSARRHLPVASFLVACNDDLEQRVHRLLAVPLTATRHPAALGKILPAAAVLISAAVLLGFEQWQSGLLAIVHNAMEHLAH